MGAMLPICVYCKNQTKEGCKHFGVLVPRLILDARFNHKTPVDKENILFEFMDDISDEKKEEINREFLDKAEAEKRMKEIEHLIF